MARIVVASRIKQPPGYVILKIADFLWSHKTLTLTFEPLVADWRHEYCEALQGGRRMKARWICIRYYWAFAKAFGLTKIVDAVKAFVRIPTK